MSSLPCVPSRRLNVSFLDWQRTFREVLALRFGLQLEEISVPLGIANAVLQTVGSTLEGGGAGMHCFGS